MAIDGRTLLVTLGIDAAIGLAAFSLFSLLRILLPAYYRPRMWVCARCSAARWAAA
jgi:hypothetical protein